MLLFQSKQARKMCLTIFQKNSSSLEYKDFLFFQRGQCMVLVKLLLRVILAFLALLTSSNTFSYFIQRISMYKSKFLILTQNHGLSSLENPIECFHMTSRRPYWCPKTMKLRPCWCPKPVLWELNSFLMQTLSFVPINLHRCWPRE